MQTIIMTSDKQIDILPGFSYQWKKYAPQLNNVVVCGFYGLSKNNIPLYFPFDIKTFIIGDEKDYPASRWSDALIKVLNDVADETFILLLEDYWLVRPADIIAIRMIRDYLHQFQNVLRFDLTDERLYSNTPPGGGYNGFYWGYNTYDTLGYLDLIKSDANSAYHMSLWGAAWRRDLLREVLVPGETAQQIEMSGRVNNRSDLLVLGTRQAPLRHVNVIQRGRWNYHDRSGIPGLKMTDRQELKERFGLDYE